MWRFRLGLACLLAVSAYVSSSADSAPAIPADLRVAGAPSSEFCKGSVLRDYAAPLREMPAVRRVPAKGLVDLGRVSLRISALPTILAGGGLVGFRTDPAADTSLKGGGAWTIRLTLTRLNASGRPRNGQGQRRRILHVARLGQLPERIRSLTFRVGPVPAFYRVDIRFRGNGGAERNWRDTRRFSEYFRVVRRTVEAALVTESRIYTPGDVVRARIENEGTSGLTFGYAFAVDRYNDTEWVEVLRSGAPLVAVDMPGAYAWGCTYLHLSKQFALGRYRIRREAVTTRSGHSLTLTAEFDVRTP
jgi:hypothetical protein